MPQGYYERPSFEEKLIMKIDRSAGPGRCWPCTVKKRAGGGYGLLSDSTGPGPRVMRRMHVAVWEIVNQRTVPLGMVVRHSCDNPPCCNPEHLLLGTQTENCQDATDRERWCSGESRKNSKLTDAKVVEIRKLAAQGASTGDLARQFGVSAGVISGVKHRKAWRHVK